MARLKNRGRRNPRTKVISPIFVRPNLGRKRTGRRHRTLREEKEKKKNLVLGYSSAEETDVDNRNSRMEFKREDGGSGDGAASVEEARLFRAIWQTSAKREDKRKDRVASSTYGSVPPIFLPPFALVITIIEFRSIPSRYDSHPPCLYRGERRDGTRDVNKKCNWIEARNQWGRKNGNEYI